MFRVRRVVGESMVPTLHPGTIVVVKPIETYEERDIVVIEHDGLEKIKRIKHINENMVYVLGDNPAESTDSREFGWVDEKIVRGKVIWPRNL